MTHTIKRFLVLYITLAVVIIYGLISFVSYAVSKDELDELYDANLQQVARTIVAQHQAVNVISDLYRPAQINSATQKEKQSEKEIKSEEELFVRVIDAQGHILYSSHPLLKVPSHSIMGLSTQKVDDKIWRFYITTANNQTIQVAQSLNRRNKTIQETALSLMAPQLIFIPILIGVIFMAISKALSPLNALSVAIQQRQSNDLQPFSPDKMPGEIKPLVNALNQFMLRVSDMVDILKRFTSDAAHELRTPITALKIQLSLLEKSKNKAERDQAITALKSGIDRSEQLVSQLLTLARIEPNNQIKQFQATDLNRLVKESIQELLPLALVKSIDLGLENSQSDNLQLNYSQLNNSLLDTAKVTFINAVPYEIKILINNMIDNAIRYTPAEGKVDVCILCEDQEIILMVNDSGPGIALTDIAHVFDRFYRGQNNDNQGSNLSSSLNLGFGSGLGLSIVKEIATQHDATIKIAQLNPGFSISVIFPTAN